MNDMPEGVFVHPIHKDYYFSISSDVYSRKLNNLTGLWNIRKLNPSKGDRYLRVAICENYKRKTIGLHRLVWETFCGIIPEGLEINHKDGNKYNNHLSNLELVTSRENVRHAVDTGLLVNKGGVDHPRSMFTKEQVNHIRSECMIQRDYAKYYDCHVTTIQRIQSKKTYKE